MELVSGRTEERSVFDRAKQADFAAYAEAYLGVVFEGVTNPKCLCPFHEDKKPSFSVSLIRNKGKCFSCMPKHGKMVDIIEFTAKLTESSMKEAAEKIVRDLNL